MKKMLTSLLKTVGRPFGIIGRWSARMAKNTARPLISPTPQGKIRLLFAGIVLVSLFFFVYIYPASWNRGADWVNGATDNVSYLQWIQIPRMSDTEFRLGLDLQGGAHLVYEADLSEIESAQRTDALEGVRDVIERRVNFLGIAEPLVQIAGKDRLIVELAGVFDIKEAVKSIGETPLLEFKEQNAEPPRQLTPEEEAQLALMNVSIKARADEAAAKLKSGTVGFEDAVTEYSDHRTKDDGGKLGWISEYTSDTAMIDVAKKMAVGTVSPVIDLSQGYTIIRLNDTRKGDQVQVRHLLVCYVGAQSCEGDLSKDDARAKIDVLKQDATPENFEQLAKENSTEPGASERGGELGFISRGQTVPAFDEAAFALEKGTISDVVETDFGFHLIYKEDERKIDEFNVDMIQINKKTSVDILGPQDPWVSTGLSGKHLERADVQFDQTTGEVMVGLQFNSEGKDLFAAITERNIQKPVAIYLDGMPISVPRVNQVIRTGQAVITGNFSIDDARDLARRLNAGALPVPITLLSQQTVGPKLGHESLSKSITAGLWGLLLVALVMIAIYRFRGFVAVLSLLVYGALVLGSFKLIGVTLTLAGIAGFILSIGMAVDANVLIFERMKEELRDGKPYLSAMEEGFKRAWPSIRDGNFSTLITCFILMQFGTSIVKGFAVTLGVGILVSMFTAMIVTKNFLKVFNFRKK